MLLSLIPVQAASDNHGHEAYVRTLVGTSNLHELGENTLVKIVLQETRSRGTGVKSRLELWRSSGAFCSGIVESDLHLTSGTSMEKWTPTRRCSVFANEVVLGSIVENKLQP